MGETGLSMYFNYYARIPAEASFDDAVKQMMLSGSEEDKTEAIYAMMLEILSRVRRIEDFVEHGNPTV